MESLIFAFNSVSPIIFTVAVGYVLKKIGLMSPDFAKSANKLVFRVFLPAMLFLNVYGIDNLSLVNIGYVIYALASLLVIFALAITLRGLSIIVRGGFGNNSNFQTDI